MKHEEFTKVVRSLWTVIEGTPTPQDSERFDRTHYRLLYRAGKEAEIFIANAVDSYNFKRWGAWRKVEGESYSSFDAYISAPHTVAMKVGENRDGSPIWEERSISFTSSTVHLGVQVVYGLCFLFYIPRRELVQIGQKKLAKLMPYLMKNVLSHGVVEFKFPTLIVSTRRDPVTGLESYSAEVESYSEYVPLRELDTDSWEVLRETVFLWLERAKTLSEPELSAMIGVERGWETAFSQPIPVASLRNFESVERLLDHLGLSDLPDDQAVIINIKYKKGGVVNVSKSGNNRAS